MPTSWCSPSWRFSASWLSFRCCSSANCNRFWDSAPGASEGDDGFGEGNFKALFESIERDQIKRGVITAKQTENA